MSSMDKSKYYYDYTRNMSYEQALEHCGKPTCEKEICICIKQNNVLKEKAKPIFLEKNENWTNKIKDGKGIIV